jgi:hypothetical protein
MHLGPPSRDAGSERLVGGDADERAEFLEGDGQAKVGFGAGGALVEQRVGFGEIGGGCGCRCRFRRRWWWCWFSWKGCCIFVWFRGWVCWR